MAVMPGFYRGCSVLEVLLLAVTALGAASAPTSTTLPPPSNATPNVLFIAIDDMRPSLGVMGAPAAMPAMDTLAGDSLLFTRAYANFPWCNPSRNSLLSGRRPDTNKVWNFNVDLRTSEPAVGATYVTIPQHFKEQGGYYTTSTGKIFHGMNRQDAFLCSAYQPILR